MSQTYDLRRLGLHGALDRTFDMIRDAGIGEAWAEAQAALPEGWAFHGLVYYHEGSVRARRRGPHWRASAVRRRDLGLPPAGMIGIGNTATAALLRLSDLLSGMNRERAAELVRNARDSGATRSSSEAGT